MTENPNMPPLVGDYYYNAAKNHPAPRGVKLLLHTEGNTCVVGQWADDGGFDAWLPLPKVCRDDSEEHA